MFVISPFKEVSVKVTNQVDWFEAKTFETLTGLKR